MKDTRNGYPFSLLVTFREFKDSLELEELVSAPKPETMENVYKNCQAVVEGVRKYEKSLLDGDLGPTSVWASFLQMVQILLFLIHSVGKTWGLELTYASYRENATMDACILSPKLCQISNLLLGNYARVT